MERTYFASSNESSDDAVDFTLRRYLVASYDIFTFSRCRPNTLYTDIPMHFC